MPREDRAQPIAIPEIGDVESQPVVDASEISGIAAVIGNEGIQHADTGTQPDQPMRQGRADEAHSAGHEHLSA